MSQNHSPNLKGFEVQIVFPLAVLVVKKTNKQKQKQSVIISTNVKKNESFFESNTVTLSQWYLIIIFSHWIIFEHQEWIVV